MHTTLPMLKPSKAKTKTWQ